jgi:hypothetical protein
MGGAVVVVGAMTLLSFLFPAEIVWVLGSKYRDLDSVVPWVVMASSIGTIANVLWVLNRGRRWLFWRGSFLEIGCLIAFQTAYVVVFGVRTTISAALFMLAASFAPLIAHLYVTIYGFATLKEGAGDLRK